MPLTIDVDVGGTFTDCVLAGEGTTFRAKTPTTGYDLSVGFQRGVEELASQAKIPTEELLAKAKVVRYSTTLGLNALIQRTGPKLGLITTFGHEHVLAIGRSRQWADGLPVQERRQLYRARKPDPLVSFDMVVGVRERIDSSGEVVIPIDPEDVRERVQYLVDRGAQGFVVSLLWSFLNNAHEKLVREVIEDEYPDYYLGSMPIILSHEVQPKRHEYPRTNVAILCAYMHREMTEGFGLVGNYLRGNGYKRPIYLINNIGGVAKLSRTRTVDTFGAGPVAGLLGSAHTARAYGLPRVLVTDMGGTSFDYGLVIDGECRSYSDWPVIDRWATEASTIEVSSIGAGGGSIAWVNAGLGGRLEVGPQSAGSDPGPACYDAGGIEPTVTDADLTLGYINPAYFLGGNLLLNPERALEALQRIARPLRVTPQEAASLVKDVVDAKMGNILAKELSLRGYSPNEFTLFANGGAGPTHAAGYGSLLKVPRILTFDHSSTSCAMGGATMDFRQRYEASALLTLYDPGLPDPYLDQTDAFRKVVESLMESAVRDIRGEGFDPAKANFELELDIAYARQYNLMRVRSPVIFPRDKPDMKAICDAFLGQYAARYTQLATEPNARINVHNYNLFASVPLPKPSLPSWDLAQPDPKGAAKGRRPIYWKTYGRFVPTETYELKLLRPGNVIEGGAVVEAVDTTIVVPPGFRYTMDHHRTGILEPL